MRRTRGIIILLVALALIVSSYARPALAQTVTTTTSSIVNRLGNTVTTTDTLVDGVLTTRNQQETKPDGTIVVEKAWDFYSSGVASRFEEHRVLGTSTTEIVRTFDALGNMQTEYADLSTNGQLSVQRFSTFDADGYLVTNEQRDLTTLADGTQVWVVTQETYSAGVLVSSEVNQFPVGTVFTDPFPIANPAPAPAPDPVVTPPPVPDPVVTPPVPDPVVTPPAPDPSPAPAPAIRPGYGYGDSNHEHSGPPGHEDDDDGYDDDGDDDDKDKDKKKSDKHDERDDREQHDDDDGDDD